MGHVRRQRILNMLLLAALTTPIVVQTYPAQAESSEQYRQTARKNNPPHLNDTKQLKGIPMHLTPDLLSRIHARADDIDTHHRFPIEDF